MPPDADAPRPALPDASADDPWAAAQTRVPGAGGARPRATTDVAQLTTALAALARLTPSDATLVGIGWATVDLERTLAGIPPHAGLSFGPETPEPALGARAQVAWAGGTAIVVLEPSTEGRLAAALARRGEGIACLYVAGPAPAGGGRLTALGRPGRVLTHDRPWGPFLLLVDP